MIENTFIHKYHFKNWNYQLLRNLTNPKLYKNNIFKIMREISNEKEQSIKSIKFISSIFVPIKFYINIFH